MNRVAQDVICLSTRCFLDRVATGVSRGRLRSTTVLPRPRWGLRPVTSQATAPSLAETGSSEQLRHESNDEDVQSRVTEEAEGRVSHRAGQSVFEAHDRALKYHSKLIGQPLAVPSAVERQLSIDRLRNNLIKYLDPTGRAPLARQFEDIETDLARRNFLDQLLNDHDLSAETFFLWRDVLSTTTLSDALARLSSWQDFDSSSRALSPKLLPCWFVQLLVKKTQTRDSAYQLFRSLFLIYEHYTPSDRAEILRVLMGLAVAHEILVLLPKITVMAIAELEAMDCTQVDAKEADKMRKPLGRLLYQYVVTLRDTSRSRYDDISLDGILRKQLGRLVDRMIAIQPEILVERRVQRLFHSRVLDARLRHSLASFYKSTDQKMSNEQIRACLLSAAKEGHQADVRYWFDRFLHITDGITEKNKMRMMAVLAKSEKAMNSLIDLSAYEEASEGKGVERSSKASSADTWVHALALASSQARQKPNDFIKLAESIPDRKQDLRTLTPVMDGLLQQKRYEKALEVFDWMVNSGVQIDIVALTLAVKATCLTTGVIPAMRLMDRHALKASANGTTPTGKIQLDSFIVNNIIECCNRHSEPTVAYRIWQAMESRWGVKPDAYTLASMLFCSARSEDALSGMSFKEAFKRTFISDQQDLGHLEESQAIPIDAYTRSLYSKGNIELLLDSASDSSGLGKLSPLTWKTGRALFRQVIFSNWPHLRHIRSAILQGEEIASGLDDLPASALHSHIIPSDVCFHAYIQLLGYHNLASEIPVALAWMKELGVTPKRSTQCLSFLYMDDSSGPTKLRTICRPDGRTTWSWLRDDEYLRVWLEDWIGVDKVPDEDAVARFRMLHVRGRMRV